tara:strand:+ start:233 stop:928 length:696 start_codon:yes stop_codon:yes gene_type:complete
MALGLALTDAIAVSTTAAVADFTFNSDGISLVESINGSGGRLYICFMAYYFDYLGNVPTAGGEYTQINTTYAENSTSSYRPTLTYNGVAYTAESSGPYDDRYIFRRNIGSMAWSDLRGDETTEGTFGSQSSNSYTLGVFAKRQSGRGSVVSSLARSYYSFDLSGDTPVADPNTAKFSMYVDNLGMLSPWNQVIIVQSTELDDTGSTTLGFGNCFVADAVATDNATFFGANF